MAVVERGKGLRIQVRSALGKGLLLKDGFHRNAVQWLTKGRRGIHLERIIAVVRVVRVVREVLVLTTRLWLSPLAATLFLGKGHFDVRVVLFVVIIIIIDAAEMTILIAMVAATAVIALIVRRQSY